jgi:hypothetical protein
MQPTTLRGALAGAVATVVMTAEEPLDQRLFDSRYDDIAVLGKLVTRGETWRPIGLALHVQNGAFFGAAYTRLKPSLRGPGVVRGLTVGLVEHVATWPLAALIDRYHPARKELAKLATMRGFGQATVRHAVFGIVLGFLEERLNGSRATPDPSAAPSGSGAH